MVGTGGPITVTVVEAALVVDVDDAVGWEEEEAEEMVGVLGDVDVDFCFAFSTAMEPPIPPPSAAPRMRSSRTMSSQNVARRRPNIRFGVGSRCSGPSSGNFNGGGWY